MCWICKDTSRAFDTLHDNTFFVFKGESKTPGKGKRNRIDSIRWNMGAGANIHDRFFKETLSHVQIARDFLENYLPPHVIRHIDLRTLRISKDSFVTPYIAFQLLRYMSEIWELERTQGRRSGRFPLIIPVVVYHGKVKGEYRSLKDLIHIPSEDLMIYVPEFMAELYDFSPRSELKIKGEILLRLVLSCLRAKNRPKAVEHLDAILELIAQLDESASALEWIKVIFRYIFEVMEVRVEKEVVMSLAQRLRMEGKEEGRIEGKAEGRMEGRIEGRAEVLRRLIRKRFGIHILPHQYEEMLKKATEEQLDLYAERILEARSLEEIFI